MSEVLSFSDELNEFRLKAKGALEPLFETIEVTKCKYHTLILWRQS